MAKNLSSEQIATRTFVLTMVCTVLYVAAVFLFVL